MRSPVPDPVRDTVRGLACDAAIPTPHREVPSAATPIRATEERVM